MAKNTKYSAWRIVRFIIVIFAAVIFFAGFLVWRTDNPRLETVRFQIRDNYIPDMDWLYAPISGIGGLVTNFQSYEAMSRENRELRQQLQQMEAWREAALQLEQINAELRALNNLSVTPQASYVTGEIIGDSGSPFSQTAVVNIGRNKGVYDGAPAVDGFGVIGRVIGVGEDKSRILLLSDPTSRVSALVMPERVKVIVQGNNGRTLDLKPVESGGRILAGSRVVTSGEGIYPAGLLLGDVIYKTPTQTAVRIAADYSALQLARILLPSDAPNIDESSAVIQGPIQLAPNALIGPAAPPTDPVPEAAPNSTEGAAPNATQDGAPNAAPDAAPAEGVNNTNGVAQ